MKSIEKNKKNKIALGTQGKEGESREGEEAAREPQQHYRASARVPLLPSTHPAESQAQDDAGPGPVQVQRPASAFELISLEVELRLIRCALLTGPQPFRKEGLALTKPIGFISVHQLHSPAQAEGIGLDARLV